MLKLFHSNLTEQMYLLNMSYAVYIISVLATVFYKGMEDSHLLTLPLYDNLMNIVLFFYIFTEIPLG